MRTLFRQSYLIMSAALWCLWFQHLTRQTENLLINHDGVFLEQHSVVGRLMSLDQTIVYTGGQTD